MCAQQLETETTVKGHFRIDDRLSITFTESSNCDYGLLTVAELTCKVLADESTQSSSSIYLTRREFSKLLDFFGDLSNKSWEDNKDSWEFNKPIWKRWQTDPRACQCYQIQNIYFDRFCMLGRIRIGKNQALFIDRISIEKTLLMKSELLASLAEIVPDETEFDWPPWQVMPCISCPSGEDELEAMEREGGSFLDFDISTRSRSPLDRQSPLLLDDSCDSQHN